MGRMVLVYALAILLFTSVSQARSWYITPDGTGDAPTIQAGVDSAASGDEVVLADGTFTGDGNRDVDLITKILTIRSESGDPEACIIDCGGSAAEHHRGFWLRANGTVLEGITIMNGYHLTGGALSVVRHDDSRSQVSIMNCRFLDNHAGYYGGAIESTQSLWGVVEISDCLFSGNSADLGGGAIYLYWHFNAYAPIEIDNCTFVDNRSFYGCILYEYYLSDQKTSHGSGSFEDPFVRFANCTIVGNSDGVLLYYGSYLNAPAGLASGGSAPLQDYWISMSQTIIAYNDLVYPFSWGAYPLLTCVDIYGNPSGDWVGAISDQYGVRGNFSDCPSFCSAEAEDFHLCDGSPCAPGNHPDGIDCGLIGALDVGCVCGPSATKPTSWGGIKSLFR